MEIVVEELMTLIEKVKTSYIHEVIFEELDSMFEIILDTLGRINNNACVRRKEVPEHS